MNTKHISLAFAAVAALLAGCAKSPINESIDGQSADLELSYVGATETKAAIDGTTFPTDGEIGLFLFENEQATKAYGTGYENVKYSYNSTKKKWTASPSIKVGSTPGYLYGYYPYSSIATDIKAIPVSSSLNGDDVMYAAKQSSPITDKTASQTTITMNHALARVSITVKNNGYTGEAKLSRIKFEGAKLAASGTLNALDGTITAAKADEVVLSVPTAEQPIATGAGTTYECLLVPSDVVSDRQDVTLSLTIDGEPKTATLSGNDNGVIFAQGTKSNITITLSNSGISVKTVSVENWNVVEVGGHKVTITVAEDVTAHDILMDAYAEGNDVIVKANSLSNKHLKCTMSDGEFCTSQSKTGNLVYTFNISDITSNTTATIGYANPINENKISPADAGCKVTVKGGDLYEGELVRLVPEAAYSYGISSWKDQNDNILSDGYDYTVRLSQEVQITACFEENLALGGVFTVANDGKGNVKKVRFTRGNLYYDDSSKVEQHQYDFNSGNWSSSGHISHFMWCDNIANATSLQYNTSWNGQAPFFANDGSFTVDGFNAGDCFALSKDEWTYLINTRIASTVNGTTSARYFRGCINKEDGKSINGLFIFPDTFTWPSSVKTQPGGINEASSGYDNTYTYNDFKRLQDAGVVFLPAAGWRDGSIGNALVGAAGIYGYYWSASSYCNNYAYELDFNSGNVSLSHYDYRNQAYAVRLVTESN